MSRENLRYADTKQQDTVFSGTEQDYQDPLSLYKILQSSNVADELSQDDLISIGNLVVDGYETDLASRAHWEKDLETWTKLALQVVDQKTYPWQGAANVKYPLLSTAAMQFAARAYPTLIPSNGQIVKCRTIGYDMDGAKSQRAERVSKHMSYQCMDEMPDWEEDMDKLLLANPIAGCSFKKSYWDANKQVICSKLVFPKYLVVNYYAKSLEEAERITEVIYLTRRQVKERINRGMFLDVDLGDPTASNTMKPTGLKDSTQMEAGEDETTPYTFLEQHCYLDLDGDDYTEPYIVTVEENSKQVVRIIPRFDSDTVQMDETGDKVVYIEPIHYYTKYGFIPNPDGGFYDIGFGRLLGPINESANTLVNQLIDAGSLSNLQAGFIGKGLKIKMGDSKFQPGEWKAVNAVGDDIKKQIFPLPVREPSDVLFKLLDLLLKSGKELASVAEIFVGKMPGQNTPATTTMASIEQGMKVFTAVYKRIYRSLTKELRKIYLLNRKYLNPQQYVSVLDMTVEQNDYQLPEDDIIPGADPSAVSSQEKQAKVQAIMQILQLGTVDPMWATQKYMEAHEITDWQQGVRQQPQKTDPKVEAMQAKNQLEQQKATRQIQMDAAKLQIEGASKEQEMALKQRAAEQEMQLKLMEHVLKAKQSNAEHQVGMQQQMAQSQLNLITSAQAAQQKNQQQKEAAKVKQQTNPKGKQVDGNKSK